MPVYKYVTAERVDVLENGMIRFTQPAALNDPFEALPCYLDWREKQLRALLKQQGLDYDDIVRSNKRAISDMFNPVLSQTLDLLGRFFGFLSLTKQRNNLLMWSHYTDSHKGFVIGFDSKSPFFKPGNGKAVDGLREVTYSKQRWRIPSDGLGELANDDMGSANVSFFFQKSDHWAYEEELRILANPHDADKTIPGNPPIWLFAFPPECVQEIILGFKMSAENKGKIAGIVAKKYSHVHLHQAILDEADFDLNIEPYT